jgi:uncharacterized protein YsxB (DUF464 family)
MYIEGHAGFAEYGKDIVCAGVTALEAALGEWMAHREGCLVSMQPSSTYFRGTADSADAMDCIWAGLRLIAYYYKNFCECKEIS